MRPLFQTASTSYRLYYNNIWGYKRSGLPQCSKLVRLSFTPYYNTRAEVTYTLARSVRVEVTNILAYYIVDSL
jgi:hypothetical protein